MRFLLLLLIPVLLFSARQFARREQNENRLALVASEVALRDVEISCPGFWARLVEITPNAGWVDFDEHGRPPDEASLSATTCRGLERVWRRDQTSFKCLIGGGCDQSTVRAVHGLVTLAHESWHLRGIVEEGRTQCDAVQMTEHVALRLGIPPEDAQADRAPRRSRRCGGAARRVPLARVPSGGAFDLRPDTLDWPSG